MVRLLKENSERGFSLIEILIALSIFAIGILAISALFDTSYRAQGSAKGLNNANRVAQSYTERLSTYGYQNVLNGMGAANYQVNGTTKTNWKYEDVNDIRYKVTIEVKENYVVTGDVDVNKALVTVTWTQRVTQRNVQYEIYL